ncbi:zinc finger protein Noc isoform X2 [Contarinia nasturtii]|nr:zinc finger protein Noc isoform X2 [Contarinia nasturtii]
MVTIGNTQYLQPDYLSPLPTTLDAKKSPLALLAQTCSQIGADTAAIKPSSGSMDKNKKSETSKSPSTISKTPRSNTSPQETRPLAFKPYELNVLTTKGSDDRPSSKASSTNGSVYDEKQKQSARVPSRNKTNGSPIELSAVNNNNSRETKSESGSVGKQTPIGLERKSTSPSGSQRGNSPIIRSGLEVLHGHSSKDLAMSGAFKPNSFGLNPLAALCCPPGMEQHASNPAFRPPFANGFAHHHAAMLAAAASYPPNTQNPYITYQRIKTPSGGETVIPICKDPYCTGCQFSQHNQHMMLGIPCPAGCTQCEQQKYGLAMAQAMSGIPPNNPYSQVDRSYMCTWVVSDGYCGKRCSSSDELVQHLRTHTPNLSDPTATAVLMQAQQRAIASMHPFGQLSLASSLHRGYPTGPQLSPLSSAARYHPYAKPSPAAAAAAAAAAATLPGSPYATFNPAALSNPYYSPYALYSQRLNAAAAAAAINNQ